MSVHQLALALGAVVGAAERAGEEHFVLGHGTGERRAIGRCGGVARVAPDRRRRRCSGGGAHCCCGGGCYLSAPPGAAGASGRVRRRRLVRPLMQGCDCRCAVREVLGSNSDMRRRLRARAACPGPAATAASAAIGCCRLGHGLGRRRLAASAAILAAAASDAALAAAVASRRSLHCGADLSFRAAAGCRSSARAPARPEVEHEITCGLHAAHDAARSSSTVCGCARARPPARGLLRCALAAAGSRGVLGGPARVPALPAALPAVPPVPEPFLGREHRLRVVLAVRDDEAVADGPPVPELPAATRCHPVPCTACILCRLLPSRLQDVEMPAVVEHRSEVPAASPPPERRDGSPRAKHRPEPQRTGAESGVAIVGSRERTNSPLPCSVGIRGLGSPAVGGRAQLAVAWKVGADPPKSSRSARTSLQPVHHAGVVRRRRSTRAGRRRLVNLQHEVSRRLDG